MSRKVQLISFTLFFIGAQLLLVFSPPFLTSASASEASTVGPWYGVPDPYDCNGFSDCFWMVTVCIDGKTYDVGIYYDPETQTKAYMEQDALDWSGIVLTMGGCSSGRWVHTYVGRTWTCNLISEAGDDKLAPRFSNIDYVLEICGDHYLYGPLLISSAKYTLHKEVTQSDGSLTGGNHYDTSIP